MAFYLVKHILNLTLRPTGDKCRTNLKKYYYYPTFTFGKEASERCLVTHSYALFQNESPISETKKMSIPLVQGNITLKKTVENEITSDDIAVIKETESEALEPCVEDVSDIGPFAMPSFHLAAYVNNSFTLQQFVLMGVKLHLIERDEEVAKFILRLDFEKHVKPHLRFLHDVGVPAEELGRFVTKNPLIFQEDLEDLQIRVNYLEAKKFTAEGISRIVARNPKWLSFSTVDIDKRLGFFQRTFILSGDEVRLLAVKRPSLITYSLGKVTLSHFAVKEEMGFNEVETKTLLLKAPKLFDIQTNALKERFHFVHNEMGIPHEQILQQPGVLLFREFIIRQRHEFLKELGKAQYDPKLPKYVSIETLAQGSDVDFCRDVAKTSIEVFNAFLIAR